MKSRSLTRLPWEHALCTFRRSHRVSCLDQPAPLFRIMAEPVLPPLPDPGLGFRVRVRIAAEPAVLLTEAAEPQPGILVLYACLATE